MEDDKYSTVAAHWTSQWVWTMSKKWVNQLCECLCIAEELKKYAFVLKSLEEMELRWKLESICLLIYSDCFIMDELLTMVGLKRPVIMGGNEGTDLIWDSHHLRSQV
jgi:hypothetical protein